MAGVGRFGDRVAKLWNEMLDIHADQVFSIGIVTATLHPSWFRTSCATCPRKASPASIPTRYFGVYQMDTFWMDDAGK